MESASSLPNDRLSRPTPAIDLEPEIDLKPDREPDLAVDQFLVCGLGSVGQHCASILKDFGVKVHAIECVHPSEWEIPNLLDCLDGFYLGDCRHIEILEVAQIRHCRAVLLVTANDRLNIEAGLAARSLNPTVRLVVRSAKTNLNDLLEQQLGNYVAFEPTELSAPAFAFAALNSKTLGFFALKDHLFEVVQHSIDRHHPWLKHPNLQHIQSRYSRLLRYRSHQPSAETGKSERRESELGQPELGQSELGQPELGQSNQFYQWDPGVSLRVGDQVITIELAERTIFQNTRNVPAPSIHLPRRWLKPSYWRGQLLNWLQVWRDRYRQQIWRVCILCSITILTLLLGGTTLLCIHYPDLHPLKALLSTIVLLLGGYGDVFGDINALYPLPWPMQFFSLSLTLAGTAFVGVLYALLTERLLTVRFQFFQRRLPLPESDHVVIIGLGRVGQRVAALLRVFHQPCVAIATTPPESHLWSKISMVTGDVHDCLGKVNLPQARSVVAITDSEMENLEVALMAHAANPHTGLVIRTYHRRFRDTVAHLFPHTQVLCASELAAEAFAAAAFGENVLSLFRLGTQTILVTDYTIEAGDTLNGLLLGEVAYGYGVVPIFHERAEYKSAQPMPSDDLRLQVGDRMVVLATIEGLKFIEKGRITPPDRTVQVVKALNADAIFQGANEIACITGCTMMTARTLMGKLPQTIPTPLYHHQAFRLVRRLGKAQVQAQITPVSSPSSPPD